MRNRTFVPSATVLIMAFGWWGSALIAQAPSGTKSFDPKTTNTDAAIKAAAETTRAMEEARKNFKAPKTPWGEPDLRGYFLNLSYTPLERPKELGDKAFYTPEEALAAFKKAVEEDAEVDPRIVHYDWKEYGMDAWQSPIRPNLHTSLIVDPPTGRIPPMAGSGRRLPGAAST
jgi:hypothetical protein